MKTDIEISRETKLLPIEEIAQKLNIEKQYVNICIVCIS